MYVLHTYCSASFLVVSSYRYCYPLGSSILAISVADIDWTNLHAERILEGKQANKVVVLEKSHTLLLLRHRQRE